MCSGAWKHLRGPRIVQAGQSRNVSTRVGDVSPLLPCASGSLSITGVQQAQIALSSCETLPPQFSCTLFSQHLLDLTHRGGPKGRTTASTLAMFTHWQPQSTMISSSTRRVFQIRFRTNSRILRSLLAYWPTCSQLLQHSSQGASPTTTFHCCTQHGQHRE